MTTIAPWCTGDEVLARMGEDVDATKLTADQVEQYAMMASESLFVISGRQFRGEVSRTVLAGVGRGHRSRAKASLGSWWPVTSVSNVIGVPNHGTPQPIDPTDWEWSGGIGLTVPVRWANQRVQADLVCGQAPPLSGKIAAEALAVELAAIDPDYGGEYETRLPSTITSISRQGVSQTFTTVLDLMKEGATGIYEVDLFLSQYNVTRSRTRPRVRTMR